MPFKLSPSSINLFKECPRCFYLQLHKLLKRPASIFPSLPGGMDRILKDHFDVFMKKGQLPPELQELNGDVVLFDDEALLNEWRIALNGLVYTDENGNILHGGIDNLLKKGKRFIVLDYKTRGYPVKGGYVEHYQHQLDIYTFLLQKLGYETEDYAYLLVYYPNKVHDNGDVDFHADLIKVDVDIKAAEQLFKDAIECLNGGIPEPGKECGFCFFREAKY